MKKLIQALTLSAILCSTSNCLAENAYIVDQLLVGLHQKKDIDSPIVKVLSTGTEVKILNREGDFAEIKEAEEGKVGWVDSSYLMLDRPAKLQVVELQKKIKTLENMQDVQATKQAQIENEQKIEELQQNLSSEKLKSGELEATISQNEKKLAHIEANGNEEKIIELTKQNTQLQEKLTAVETVESTDVGDTPQVLVMQLYKTFIKKPILLIMPLILFLTAFFFGRWWEDRNTRKRHGGFRI